MDYMEHSLSLARRVLGRTSPNPAVGAVIVQDGVVVGQGNTKPPGQAHAEIVALEQAGEAAKGANLYVTLEPCCFLGRTPPCTQAIIEAGIAEAHIATLDPNPKVSGKGKKELEEAGIKIYIGERGREAERVNEAYLKFITTGRPFVTAKFAASLDGKIATHTGESQWITGEQARQRGHDLRRTADAIVVGVNTVLADDPRLTARDAQGVLDDLQPLRVVVDSKARTPTKARVLEGSGHVLLAVSQIETEKRTALEKSGVEVVVLPRGDSGVDLDALMVLLGERELTHVLVEGGGTLLGSFFDRGLVDKVVAFLASAIIGGDQAPTVVGGVGAESMADIARLQEVEVKQLGPDVMITGYL